MIVFDVNKGLAKGTKFRDKRVGHMSFGEKDVLFWRNLNSIEILRFI